VSAESKKAAVAARLVDINARDAAKAGERTVEPDVDPADKDALTASIDALRAKYRR
jgi:hypothetical protein